MANLILGTAPGCTPTNGCCAGIADNLGGPYSPAYLSMLAGGPSSVGSVTANLGTAGSGSGATAVYYIGTIGDAAGATVLAGTWVVPLGITSFSMSGGTSTIKSIYICRADGSSGASLSTIGHITPNQAITGTGSFTFYIPGVQTTFGANDIVVVSFQIANTFPATLGIDVSGPGVAPATGGPVLVQQASQSANAAGVGVTLTTPATVGNVLVVSIFGKSGIPSLPLTVTGSGGNTYVKDVQQHDTTTGLHCSIWHANVTGTISSGFNVNANVTGGSAADYIALTVYELNNAAGGPDGTPTGSFQNHTSSLAPGIQTPTGPADFAVAAMSTTPGQSYSQPVGWSVSLGQTLGAAVYQQLTNAGSQNPSWTGFNQQSSNSVATVMALYGTTATAAAPPFTPGPAVALALGRTPQFAAASSTTTPVLVQHQGSSGTGAGVVTTLASSPVVGNTLIATVYGVSSVASLPLTITDSAGNSYVRDVQQHSYPPGLHASTWHAVVATTATPFSVTASVAGGGSGSDTIALTVYEVSGLSSTQPDTTPTTGTASGSSSISTGTNTPIGSADFSVAVMAVTPPQTFNQPSGYTVGQSTSGGSSLYRQLTGISPQNPTWANFATPSGNTIYAQNVLYAAGTVVSGSLTLTPNAAIAIDLSRTPVFTQTLPAVAFKPLPAVAIALGRIPKFTSALIHYYPRAAVALSLPLAKPLFNNVSMGARRPGPAIAIAATPKFVSSGSTLFQPLPAVALALSPQQEFLTSLPTLRILRGPYSFVDPKLAGQMILQEGEPYEAGLVQGNTVYTVIFIGGHDGANKIVGGGFQATSGRPMFPAIPGMALYDCVAGVLWIGNQDGSWSSH